MFSFKVTKFKLCNTNIKDVVSEALMGVVLGSGNWSRDSRGARGSSAEEPDID